MPMAILGGIALMAFAAVYLLDTAVTHGTPDDQVSGFTRYVHLEPTLISDAVSGLAAMTAAVLGIVITVVSLLVQLTSARYTGVAQMFLRDRRNVSVMASPETRFLSSVGVPSATIVPWSMMRMRSLSESASSI